MQIFTMRAKRSGFTLIELLVVIAIIGVLASIIGVALNTSRQKARDTGRVQAIQQLKRALELYYTTNGVYPGGDETGTGAGSYASLVPTYISSIPIGPQGEVYQYQGLSSLTTGGACAIGSNCQSYHLGVKLEQGANTGVMLTDKDAENVAGPTNGTTIDGISTLPDCAVDPSATVTTDLCYDLTP